MIVVIAGSIKDTPTVKEITAQIKKFGIQFKVHFASAHKTPEYLIKLVNSFDRNNSGVVYIAVAGRSNALGGFIDGLSVNPVINCPPYSDSFAGMDILSS